MALLKDLIVNGSSRFIGDAYFNTIKEGVWNGARLGKDYVPSETVYTNADNVIKGSAADKDVLSVVNQSTSTKKAWITYKYGTTPTLLGRLGIGTISNTVTPYWSDGNKEHIIYHDGNLPTAFAKWTNDASIQIGNSSTKKFNAGSVLQFTLSEIGVQNTWRDIRINNTSIGNNILNINATSTTQNGVTSFNVANTWRQVQINNTTIGNNTLNLKSGNGITLSNSNGAVTFTFSDSRATNWDSVYNWYTGITESDTDDTINKWNEIVKFLENYKESDTLKSLLDNKLSLTSLTTTGDAITNTAFYTASSNLHLASGDPNFSSSSTRYAILKYSDSGIAFSNKGEIKVLNAGTWKNILTTDNSSVSQSGNLVAIKINETSKMVPNTDYNDGRYVKLTGSEMTGTLKINMESNQSVLWLDHTDDLYRRIVFRNNNTNLGAIGWHSDKGGLVRYASDLSTAYKILDTGNTNYSTTTTTTTDYYGKINGQYITRVQKANQVLISPATDDKDYYPTLSTSSSSSSVQSLNNSSGLKFKSTSTSKQITLGSATITYNSTTNALEIVC